MTTPLRQTVPCSDTSKPIAQALEMATRLSGRPGRFILISGRHGQGLGTRSLVGSDPDIVVRGTIGDVRAYCPDGTEAARGHNPYDFLASQLKAMATHDDAPPLAVGYFNYELGAERCGIAAWPSSDGATDKAATMWFGIYRAWWEISHPADCDDLGSSDLTVENQPLGYVLGSNASSVETLQRRLTGSTSRGIKATVGPRIGPLLAGPNVDEHYREGFARVRNYLLAGDCYQVNLSRRLRASVDKPGDPLALFAQLCTHKPEPYAAMIETGGSTILSGSPERFIRCHPRSGRIDTRPIKGTRARTGIANADERARDELIASAKERAEHLMIVDLERNDLGKVAEIGSVLVESFSEIISLPTLFHMVSTVSATLRPQITLKAILESTFPGGSITGAPKKRAMEIIRELEPGPRGVYTGAIGTIRLGLGPWPDIDLSIAIRTAVLDRSELSLHVGGGLVIDSELDREFAETEEKAAGWRRVLGSKQLKTGAGDE